MHACKNSKPQGLEDNLKHELLRTNRCMRLSSCNDHHNLLHHSPLWKKKSCVRQVVLDKWLPLNTRGIQYRAVQYKGGVHYMTTTDFRTSTRIVTRARTPSDASARRSRQLVLRRALYARVSQATRKSARQGDGGKGEEARGRGRDGGTRRDRRQAAEAGADRDRATRRDRRQSQPTRLLFQQPRRPTGRPGRDVSYHYHAHYQLLVSSLLRISSVYTYYEHY